ncbi:hypothetical protein STEG23_003790 [Scotinomys teguina]
MGKSKESKCPTGSRGVGEGGRRDRTVKLSQKCFRALCCKGPPPARPEYDLVCIGLTGSGKSSLLSRLCSESPENVVSTTEPEEWNPEA